METSSRTSTTLLEGLFDTSDRRIWREFDARYRPIVTGFARRLGLSLHEAEDAAQDVLSDFVKEYRAGNYDRSRGRLRSWLIGMVKTRIAQVKRLQVRRRERRGASALVELTDAPDLDLAWDQERKLALLRQALLELRETSRTSAKTLEAFEQYVLQRRPAQEVARRLGVTAQEVYVAKNRVADRVRNIVARLDGLFDDG